MGQLGRRGQDLADRASQEGLAKGGGTVHVNPDGSIDIDPASGKQAQVQGDLDVTGTITGTVNVTQLQLEDDEQLQFGDAPDYWQEYELANTRWRFVSADIDGGGTTGDILRVADGTRSLQLFGDVEFVNGAATLFESGNANQLNLRTDGNVAMANSLKVGGTGAPDVGLHLASNDFPTLKIEGTDPTIGLFETDTTDENWGLQVGAGKLLLRTRSDTFVSQTNVMAWLQNGNVGIGTENPGARLEVDGDININPTNTYSLLNVTTDRTFDADSTTTAELADVLGTLINDLGMDA